MNPDTIPKHTISYKVIPYQTFPGLSLLFSSCLFRIWWHIPEGKKEALSVVFAFIICDGLYIFN